MDTYRPDQGRMARMFAFWSLVFMLLFGASFVYRQFFDHLDGLRQPLGGIQVPVLNAPLNGALLIASAVFVIGMIFLVRWQRREKTADFLIATEGELKKVTWPAWPEVLNSSLVVIVCVLILMSFLALVDIFYGRLFERIFLS